MGMLKDQRALQISIINSTNYSININTIFNIAGFQIDWLASPMDTFPLADQEQKGPPQAISSLWLVIDGSMLASQIQILQDQKGHPWFGK